MTGLLRPDDLKQISSDAEIKKMEEELLKKEKKDQAQKELHDAFETRDLHPDVINRVNNAIRIAAQHGHQQLLALTFPASYCTDGGRRINIGDPEWPSTLQGFAKKAHAFFEKELRPLGFRVHAEIITFPGGMPGDVGIYLKW